MPQLELGDITADVVLKNVKNIHLSVYPPAGRVRISAPEQMDLETVRIFALSKLGWIRAQRRKLQTQARETPRELLERESHYLWGKRYLLSVREHDGPPRVELGHRQLRLWLRPALTEAQRVGVLEGWYREQLRSALPELVAKWQPRLGVEVERFFVRRMKTKWGSCNPVRKSVRLNTDLAKKPPVCLEYVFVHELVHLLEPTHNRRFVALMDTFMPEWAFYQKELNRLPVRQERWSR